MFDNRRTVTRLSNGVEFDWDGYEDNRISHHCIESYALDVVELVRTEEIMRQLLVQARRSLEEGEKLVPSLRMRVRRIDGKPISGTEEAG